MTWGTVSIGPAVFREELATQVQAGDVRVAGQEAHPPKSRGEVLAAHHNITQARGLLLPVVFTDKSELTGYYVVTDSQSQLMQFDAGRVTTSSWQATLALVGTARDVEIESRVPTIPRLTEVGGAPAAVFWHAPAGGATSYLTGPTVPAGTVTRLGADGPVTVYTGLPPGVSPRWTCPPETYLVGGSQVLFDGVVRIGASTPPLVVWQVDNGLVRVQAGPSGSFTVACWGGAGWVSSKTFAVTVNGTQVAVQPEFSLLRNDPEEVAFRLSYPTTPGRVTVDLSLRRGARFVTAVMKRHSAAALGVTRTTADAATAVTGGLRAASPDSDGNRFVLGSSRTTTTTLPTASITKASTTFLDFFAGHEVGATPQAGDTYSDLFAQYLGSSGEQARVVRR